MVGELAARLDAFVVALKRGTSHHVNAQQTKNAAIELSKAYFQLFRPNLAETLPSDSLIQYDAGWQRLLELAHSNSRRSTYLTVLAALKRQTTALSVARASAPPLRPVADHSALETAIINTLDNLVPSAGASYRQALADLVASDRVSYRGSACELRESFREILDHLAPDKSVVEQAGFTLEPKQTRPTMKQKIRFVFRSRGQGGTTGALAEQSVALIENIYGDVGRAFYNRASLSTHVATSKKELEKLKRYVDTVFCDLLEISVRD